MREEWYYNVKRTFRVFFRTEKIGSIKNIIEDLRECNDDFEQLCQNVVQDSRDAVRSKSPYGTSRALEIFMSASRIRLASLDLFDTIVAKWCCSLTVNHSANLCVGQEATEGVVRSNPTIKSHVVQEAKPTINFKLVWAHRSADGAAQSPLWLTVDMENNESHLSSGTAEQGNRTASTTPHDQNTINSGQPFPEQRKSVRFVDNSYEALTSRNLGRDATSNCGQSHGSKGSHLQFDHEFELCHYFSGQLNSTKTDWLGFWSPSRMYSLIVTRQDAKSTPEAVSLADVVHMNAAAKAPQSPLTIFQLAKLLSMTVLEYSSTPWLANKWRSIDIRFFKIGDSQDKSTLTSPHLSAKFVQRQPNGSGNLMVPNDIELDFQDLDMSCDRNETLFGLGIVLLELGFTKPWKSLRKDVCLERISGKINDYTIAMKLSRTLSNQIGFEYAEVVRKCLGCDFGLGENDFTSVDLQQRFASEVIHVLEKLCRDMQMRCDGESG